MGAGPRARGDRDDRAGRRRAHGRRAGQRRDLGAGRGDRHADQAAAAEFLDVYAGTGAFWNSSTRLLDGFKLFSVPETGINIDAVPGPRGPVTFRDLYLRQFVVTPANRLGPGYLPFSPPLIPGEGGQRQADDDRARDGDQAAGERADGW